MAADAVLNIRLCRVQYSFQHHLIEADVLVNLFKNCVKEFGPE